MATATSIGSMPPATNAASGRRLSARWLAIILGAVVLALLGALLWSLFHGKSDAPRKAPKISLIPLAPPPPPPKEEKRPDPPKEEKRPEPLKEQPEIKPPAPVEQKAPAPEPGPELKMEGAAGDGPSAFSAGRVVNENQIPAGRGVEAKPERAVEAAPRRPLDRSGLIAPPERSDLFAPPEKSGPLNPPETSGLFTAPEKPAPFNPLEKSTLFNSLANYGRLLKTEAQRHFNQNRSLRQRAYRVEVLLWIAEDGRTSRSELVVGSGDDDTDGLLRESLATLPPFSGGPPAGMQLPIRLAITTGGRG